MSGKKGRPKVENERLYAHLKKVAAEQKEHNKKVRSMIEAGARMGEVHK